MSEINELVFILDASGSMYALREDVVGGFNSILESQKKIEGETYVTVVLFNSSGHTLVDRLNIKDVKALSLNDYVPQGTTALYDAIGYSIKRIQKIHHYLRKEDIPSKLTFFITTDGYENASQRFKAKEIKAMISELSIGGKWEFNFLAQGIDVEDYAEDLGLDRDCCACFESNKAGTMQQFAHINERVTARRRGK